MKHRRIFALAAAFAAGALTAGAAFADSTSHSATARHQLSACMTKRMAASRTLSYNDAAKTCKAELSTNPPALASAVPAKPAGPMDR